MGDAGMTANVLFRAEMRTRSPLCRQRQPLLGLARPIDGNKIKKLVDKGAHCRACGQTYHMACYQLSRAVFRHKVINIARTRAEERTPPALSERRHGGTDLTCVTNATFRLRVMCPVCSALGSL